MTTKVNREGCVFGMSSEADIREELPELMTYLDNRGIECIETLLGALDRSHAREEKLKVCVETLLKGLDESNTREDKLKEAYSRFIDSWIEGDLG